jgi:hypothetical protein
MKVWQQKCHAGHVSAGGGLASEHEDIQLVDELENGGCSCNHCAATNVFASTISPFSSARQRSGNVNSTN